MRMITLTGKPVIAIILLTICLSTIPQVLAGKNGQISQVPESTKTAILNKALHWLTLNQSSDGSFLGEHYEHHTAAAAYALWLNDTSSAKAKLAYTWLANRIDNASYDPFWGPYAEADILGMVLYSLGASQNSNLIHIADAAANLLRLHQQDGGFKGYFSLDANSAVSSSVDTALALRGLIIAKATNASLLQAAVNYLFALQNSDGSFNLTRTKSYDPIYYQGPGHVSITALVLLALKDASISKDDTRILRGLDFLARASSQNYPSRIDNATVLGASLSVLAFTAFDRPNDTSNVLSWILSHQDSSGGFTRGSSIIPDPYDTAWAAIALEQPQTQPAAPVQPQTTNILILAIIAVATAGLGTFLFLRRRTKGQRLRPNKS